MNEMAAWRVTARGVFLVFAVLFAVFLITELRTVILQLLIAAIIAAAASPVIDIPTKSRWATEHRWKLGRGLVTLLFYLLVIVVTVIAVTLIVRTIAPEFSRLAANLPDYVDRAQTWLTEQISQHPELSGLAGGNEIRAAIQNALGFSGRVVSQGFQVFSGVLNALFTIILAIYLTVDGERVRDYLISLLPFERQGQATRISEHIGRRLGSWARGQALLCLIIGGLTWIGVTLLGLPYGAALATIAAVGELIPTLGPIVASIPLIAVGFTVSPTHGLLALGLAVLVQQLENNLIVPQVMGQAVELHPVVVMVAILSGGELLGVTGALLAVPVAASLAVVADEIQHERLARRVTDPEPTG